MIWGPRNTEKGFLFLAALAALGLPWSLTHSLIVLDSKHSSLPDQTPSSQNWWGSWENMTWPTKRQRQRQWQIHLENTFKERSLKLFTSESESEWQKGPNLPAHMSPYLFHPCSTLFHPFGASRAAYGQKSTFLAIFRPFSAPPEPTDGNFWTEKWSQSTGPYVPSLVPPLFHFVPPIWGVQNPLMAYVPKYGHFWAVFGHKSALNGWNKVWSNWHTVYPTPPDQIQSLVLSN